MFQKYIFKNLPNRSILLVLVTLLAIVFAIFSLSSHKANTGVVIFDRAAVAEGLNLIVSFNPTCSSSLADLHGNILKVLPGCYAYFLKSGDIATKLTDSRGSYLSVINRSGIKWKTKLDVDHDITQSPIDQKIWTIAVDYKEQNGHLLREESIYAYSLDGKPRYHFNFNEHLNQLGFIDGRSPNLHSFIMMNWNNYNNKLTFAYTHINSIQILGNNPLAVKDETFKPGNILLSDDYRGIMILNPHAGKIVWFYRPDETFIHSSQHYAHMLENGNVLFFFNHVQNSLSLENTSQYSLVREFNPLNKKTVWEYKAEVPHEIMNDRLGSAQRLPNGNTLISYMKQATKGGSALEITNEGRLVWKWINPLKDPTGKPYDVYRMERIPREVVKNWIIDD